MAKEATNTRDKLIQTASELIWSESYNAVSVDEICKKAGVKKGSFYHYFKSKAHLALETMSSCMEETKLKYDDIFSPTRHPVERFKGMVSHVIEQQKEISEQLGHVCGCPFATLGSELAGQDAEIAKTVSDICAKKTTYYETALRDLRAAGFVSKDIDVTRKANEIFSLIIGQLIMARIKDDLEFMENNLEHALFDLIGIKATMLDEYQLTG